MNTSASAKHLFVCHEPCLRARWVEAFPAAQLCAEPSAAESADVVWLVLPGNGDVAAAVTAARQALPGKPVVALSDVPEDAQGLLALGAGAAGYCNGHAQAEVLLQVAATVASGGVWVGQSLMQRLVTSAVQRIGVAAKPVSASDKPAWAAMLTEREIDVVHALSSGAANKEIARQLDITERTVKAHLASVFDKLKVRDRLQLTLLVNRPNRA